MSGAASDWRKAQRARQWLAAASQAPLHVSRVHSSACLISGPEPLVERARANVAFKRLLTSASEPVLNASDRGLMGRIIVCVLGEPWTAGAVGEVGQRGDRGEEGTVAAVQCDEAGQRGDRGEEGTVGAVQGGEVGQRGDRGEEGAVGAVQESEVVQCGDRGEEGTVEAVQAGEAGQFLWRFGANLTHVWFEVRGSDCMSSE
jgi:hypothetical protein